MFDENLHIRQRKLKTVKNVPFQTLKGDIIWVRSSL